MKNIILTFIFCIITCNAIFGAEIKYTEANGAYWYLKAFKMFPHFDDDAKFSNINKLTHLGKLAPNTIRGLESVLNADFMQCLKKANTSSYCEFCPVPSKPSDSTFNYNFIKEGYIYTNALAWVAVSKGKDKAAANIWLSMLKMSEFSSFYQYTSSTIILGVSLQKLILSSIKSYIKSGTDDTAKQHLLNYLSEKPDTGYDIKTTLQGDYRYSIGSVDLYQKDVQAFAKYLGGNISPNQREITMCQGMLKTISNGLIKLLKDRDDSDNNPIKRMLKNNYGFNLNNDLDGSNLDQIIDIISKAGYVRDGVNLNCPLGGKRTISWNESATKYFDRFIIDCSCAEDFKAPDRLSEDDPNMRIAKEYLDNRFESDKEQFDEYWDKIFNFDFDNASNDEIRNLFNKSNKEYLENLLIRQFGVGPLSATLAKNLKDISRYRKAVVEDYLTPVEFENSDSDEINESSSLENAVSDGFED